jgi:hypothetical protein
MLFPLQTGIFLIVFSIYNNHLIMLIRVLTKKLPEEVTIEIEALDIDETATSFVSANPYKENVLLNLCADS